MTNPFQARLEKAQARLAKLEAQYARFDANAMPGTYVTGNSGVSASRRAKLDRQIERTVDMSSALVAARAKVALLVRSVELYDQGAINAQGRSISRSKATVKQPSVRKDGKPRLFIAPYSEGFVYCDRYREKAGDYLSLAFLSYRRLELEWYKDIGKVTEELRQEIEAHAASIQARRGEDYQIAGNVTITLGGVSAKG
jgi:hypothetical protein